MKYFILTLSLTLFVLFINCTEKKQEADQHQVAGLRTTSLEFMKSLKGNLIREIQSGGLVHAVSVCSDTAQILTNNFGIQKGVFIRRVSLKNRNPYNYPDDFEKKVLNEFELLKQNNELDDETEYSAVVKEGESSYLRYLKPIVVQAECLNCHGTKEAMLPDVKNLIAGKYPEDKAFGFGIGDLRGAVSVKKVIE